MHNQPPHAHAHARLIFGATLLALFCALPTNAAFIKYQGWAERGGARVTTGSALSTTRVQQSVPLATYTVKLTGTSTSATLYSDAAGSSPLTCPCAADSAGAFSFYTSPGQYDVAFTAAGLPNWTITITVGGGGTGFGANTFNVVSEGAAGGTDSTTAFVAAWTKAIAASPATIYIPGATSAYTVTTCLPAFVGKPVRVYGDGNIASVINFAPTTPCGALMTWQPAANQYTLNFVQANGFAITGSNSVTKTGLRTIGTSYGSHFEDIRIQLLHTGDTAHDIQGWDTTTLNDCFYEATYPIAIKKLTAGLGTGAGSFDHFNLHNLYLYSYDDTQPLISFESGVTCSNLSVTGRQPWVGGTDAVKFISTGQFNFNSFSNIRWENGQVQIVTPVLHGYMFDIEPGAGSQQVSFINCSAGSQGAQGWKLRNLSNVNFFGTSFIGSWASNFTQIDIDNTCNYIQLANAFFASSNNALRTLGTALIEMSGAPVISTNGTTFPAFAYYAKSSPAGVDYDAMTIYGQEVWKSYTATLAVGASIALPTPGSFKAPALARITVIANRDNVADATFAGGIFLTGWYGAVVLSDAAANLAASDTAGKLSLIYAGGGNPLTLKNNLAVAIRVKIIVD
jgi:hypothetical protein